MKKKSPQLSDGKGLLSTTIGKDIDMSSLALSFNEVKFNPVPRQDGQIWLSSGELAQALGYKQENAVSKIFNRNSDEFTENMTQIIDNPRLPNLGMRIFSLRGCHLIAMFARTAVGKQFRKWVLDVLDKEIGASVTTVGTLGGGAPLGAALIGSGIGMMLGGVAMMLMPKIETTQDQNQDGNRANKGFGGAVTTVAQGNPVPILYGQREIGGFIVSAGQYPEDQM